MFNQAKYANNYNKNNYKQFSLRVNKSDVEVLDWLDKQDSINAYILKLIKQDIEDEKIVQKIKKEKNI